MKIHIKINQLKALLVFALAFGVVAFFNSAEAFAATRTWDGDGADDNWSTATNWDTDTAPVNGDNLVFTLANEGISSTNDISNLEISGILANGVGDADTYFSITISSPLTLTGDVTSSYTGVYAPDISIGGDIILGADVIFTNVDFQSRPGEAANDAINLNGHKMTLKTDALYSSGVIGVAQMIIGTGTFDIDVRDSVTVFLAQQPYVPGGNTYSGTTNLLSGGTATSGGNTNTMFGSSAINVSPTATLAVYTDGTSPFTVTNTINFLGSTIGDNHWLGDQLYIWADVPNQVINMPNVILQGNTRFALNNSGAEGSVANLAGIQSNGFCVQYGDENNTQASSFQNGPPACVIGSSVTTVPGAPQAGEMLRSPFVAAIAGLVGLGVAGFALQRGLAFAKNRR